MSRRLALAAALALTGCLVEPLSDDGARISLAVGGLPPMTTLAASAPSPWDSQGFFQLSTFPKLVRVAVEAQDFELKTGTWPNVEHGIGVGEGPAGEVTVELQVPAGAGRRLRALAFVTAPQQVVVYEEQQVQLLDLVAGQARDIVLPMVHRAPGSASIAVRCATGNQGPWQPSEVSVVDARALVIHPPRPVVADAQGALTAQIDGLPLARYHWVRTIVRHATTGQRQVVDFRAQTFAVASAGDQALVSLIIPCDAL
jgi:hypothetical protein